MELQEEMEIISGSKESSTFSLSYKSLPHFFLFFIIFITQIITKRKESDFNEITDSKELEYGNRLRMKYIVIYQLAKTIDWCLSPFMFEFFSSYHDFPLKKIAQLLAISFLSSMLLGPLFVGYISDRSNKKLSCLFYGIAIIASCLSRMLKHNMNAIIFSQITFGVATSTLYSCFENWLVSDAKLNIKDGRIVSFVLSGAFERSMILDSLLAVGISIVTSHVKANFGVESPYYLAIILSIVNMVLVIILVPDIDNSHLEKDPVKLKFDQENLYELSDIYWNLKNSFTEISEKPFLYLIGLTESIFLCIMHIFTFIWGPKLHEQNPDADTGEVFTLFMFSLTTGATLFKAFLLLLKYDNMRLVKINSAICLLAFLGVNYYEGYTYHLYSFMMFELSVGIFFPTYSMIKYDYLKDKNRATIMNLFKVPLNAVLIGLLLGLGMLSDLESMLFINLVLAFVLFLIHFQYFYKTEEELINRENIKTYNDFEKEQKEKQEKEEEEKAMEKTKFAKRIEEKEAAAKAASLVKDVDKDKEKIL